MPTLGKLARRRAHVYCAHGGKINRRQQVDRMETTVNWIQAQFRLTGLEQIGKQHVIAFWKANRKMASGTADGYWRAIKLLWELLGRAEEVPHPWPKKAPDPVASKPG